MVTIQNTIKEIRGNIRYIRRNWRISQKRRDGNSVKIWEQKLRRYQNDLNALLFQYSVIAVKHLQLFTSVRNGTYFVDGEKVAEKILQHPDRILEEKNPIPAFPVTKAFVRQACSEGMEWWLICDKQFSELNDVEKAFLQRAGNAWNRFARELMFVPNVVEVENYLEGSDTFRRGHFREESNKIEEPENNENENDKMVELMNDKNIVDPEEEFKGEE